MTSINSYIKKTSFFSVLIALFSITSLFAQSDYKDRKLETLQWRVPVNIPISLAGSFGELRPTHFHAGIDFKTNGKEGYRIYAVNDGYVSRIKITGGGYGKALYITHPDGYTSVYAHLSSFSLQIDEYVKKRQYEKESFEVDLFLQNDEIPVTKGEVIGISGNTGSSSGPHLHFEIRDTESEHPLNPLLLGYSVRDTIAPKMYELHVYPLDGNARINGSAQKQVFQLTGGTKGFRLQDTKKLNISGTVGLGIKVNDFINGSPNRCGVFRLQMLVNGELYFESEFAEMSFDEAKYIKSYMDYRESEKNKSRLHKMFREPNNKLSLYKSLINDGEIKIESMPNESKIVIRAFDVLGNSAELKLTITKDTLAYREIKTENGYLVRWNKDFIADTLGALVKISKNSLYRDFVFTVSQFNDSNKALLSEVYSIGDRYVPLHQSFLISLPLKNTSNAVEHDKLLLACKSNKGEWIEAGGKYVAGRVEARVSEFGTYAVMCDTVMPEIVPLGVLNTSADFSKNSIIKLKIDDKLSGIDSFKGTINGDWVLFEYDPKNKSVSFDFGHRPDIKGAFVLEFEVSDKKGNTAYYTRACNR